MRRAPFLFVLPLLLLLSADGLAQHPAANALQSAQEEYRAKSQILTLKGELLGGEFRISNVIPLRGDFSKYERIEVTRLQSLIGDDIPAMVLAEYGRHLFQQFQRGGRFDDLVMIDQYTPPARQKAPPASPSRAASDYYSQIEAAEERDTLDGPMLTWDDMRKFDQLRLRRLEAAQTPKDKSPRTLVIVGEVVDYAAGNRWLQFLPLNMGNSVFTIRFRYYDKETGEEVGRQVITGEVSAANPGGVLGLRTALSGVVEGLVDQVTRRAISAER